MASLALNKSSVVVRASATSRKAVVAVRAQKADVPEMVSGAGLVLSLWRTRVGASPQWREQKEARA